MKTRSDASAESLVRRIVESSIDAVRPSALFEKSFHLSARGIDAFGTVVDIPQRRGVKCISIGKSAEAMALEVRKKLGERVSGIVATPVERHLGIQGFDFYKTGHPFPDDESVRTGKAVRDLIAASGRNDLLLFLISGGGSASIFLPIEGVTLADANRLMKLLFDSGIPINKVNLVRRHLSMLAGGKLAAMAPKQEKLSLVISDVVGDDLHSIASGPTIVDDTSPADALKFLEGSGLFDRVPESVPSALMEQQVHRSISQGSGGIVKIIASNRDALEAAEKAGTESGFNTIILTRFWESDVEEAARFVAAVARSVELDGTPVSRPALILAGGETTVKLSGAGKGGRNQHMVLCALREMAKLMERGTRLNGTTVFSFGTDGRDGNSEAAGAFASVDTIADVPGGLRDIEDCIARNDSYTFFADHGGLITTGPTDTNVMDIFGAVIE